MATGDSPATAKEIHPALNDEEMEAIKEYREKLAHKTLADCHRLYYEWTVTKRLSRRQHTLLGKYLFGG